MRRLNWKWIVDWSIIGLAIVSVVAFLLFPSGCRPSPTDPSSDSLRCIPSDNCTGDGVHIQPLSDAEVNALELQVVDEFRERVARGEFRDPGTWEHIPVHWEPGFFAAGEVGAAGETVYPAYIRVSTVQSWRTADLVTHECYHWWYQRLTGDPDPNHRRYYRT